MNETMQRTTAASGRPILWRVRIGEWKRSQWTISYLCDRDRMEVTIYAKSDGEAARLKADAEQLLLHI